MQLLGHRWYDPLTGRFLTKDPIGSGDNWYAYCDNNPLTSVDPDGLKVRFVGFTAAQEAKARAQLKRIGRSKAGRQLVYDLVNDTKDHIISPPNRPGSPHYNRQTGRLRYDPNEALTLPTQGPNGKPLPSPPDVILIHELGHIYGRNDPYVGASPQPGANVYDFENPYRRERKLPRRMKY